MATAVSVTRTNNAEIDGLLGGAKWTGTITYSFPDSAGDYLSGYSSKNEPNTGFSQALAAEQTAINYAVGLVLSYTNASFQFNGANSANIQIAQSSAANPTSYAYYPSNSSTGTGGDVWFGTSYDYSQAKLGNYYFATAVHELGHALGLKHSQETGGVANVAVPSAHDNSQFTIMSYRSYPGGPLTGYTNEAYGYPQTYMANDILALQTLYGANFTTHSENTTYSWNPTTGQEFINGVGQPAPGGGIGGSANRVFMTVWDGGGVDTYDLSNYTTAQTINLNPGASSTVSATQIAYLGNGHYAQGNIFNAYLYNNDSRAYIENAVAGSGNDSLTGNPIGNYLDGGAGNDTLTGGAGNDLIIGSSGTDTAVFSGNRANYLVSYNSATQTFTTVDQRAGSPDGTDTINGVENFQFADGLFASSSFTAAAPVNHAPVLTVSAGSITMIAGRSLQASTLFSASDADNDALTYYFQDGGAADSGYFRLNGTPYAQGASFSVNAAQLAQLTYVAGAAGVADDISMQLSDGYAGSAIGQLHVNVNANHAPVLTVPAGSITINGGQSLQASTLFSAVDADNDALTYYFQDGNAANSGYFVLNGTAFAQGANFGVSAAQLANLTYVAGAKGVADDISMQLSDGYAVSAVGQLHVNVNVNRAPVLTMTAGSIAMNMGHSLQASSLFSAADADNDALTYYFQDGSAANSGRFVLNGTPFAQGANFGVSAAQLANLTYVAGAKGVADDISMQLSDGYAGSAIGQVHFNVKLTEPTPSDFNGDGRSDMLLLNDATRGWYVCEMNGAQIGVNAQVGTFTAGWRYDGLGDFNADGKSDVVLLNDATHQVYAVEMNGVAMGPEALIATVRADLGWAYKGLGDFNGDGKSDFFLLNDASRGVYVCTMDGVQRGSEGFTGTIDAGWTYQTLGDFNGDGKSDFLFLNDATHGVELWQMDGTGIAADAVIGAIDAAQGWRFKDTADFNGDGKTDLLLLNDANNHLMIWQIDGTQTPLKVDIGAAPAGSHFLDTGDFNGDGKADFAFLNDATSKVTVWQMNGTQLQATAEVGTVLAGYHYVGEGDFNGDGKTDLVFQNDATRAEQLWQMNGTGILENSQMAQLAQGWHLVI